MISDLNNLAMLYGCWLLDSDGCDLEGLKKQHLEYVEAAIKYFFDCCELYFEDLCENEKEFIKECFSEPLDILLGELDSHYYTPPELITE